MEAALPKCLSDAVCGSHWTEEGVIFVPCLAQPACPTRYVHIGQIVAIQRAIRPYTGPVAMGPGPTCLCEGCGEAQRGGGWHASKSPSVWSAVLFWGQPPQAIAYLTCKATTKRGGVVPKVNCRIWGVGGGFEITSWGEIAAGKNYCRPPFRARNWGDCKKLEPVRLHETHLLQRVDIQSILFWWIPPLNWLHVDHSDGSLPFHHLPMVSYHRKPLKTMLQWLPLWSNYR